MRALVQRVERAEVTSRAGPDDPWAVAGSIDAGLCVFVGVTHDDDERRAAALASKIWGLRILDDDDGVMNVSLSDSDSPSVLVVSQFTLYGDTGKGRRPSWSGAAPPEVAEPLVDAVVERLRELGSGSGLHLATGRFRTEMRVDLINAGPVTVMIEV